MTNETKSALEQLRERLQGHARVQVCTLEAKDCAELVLLVDRALDDARTLKEKIRFAEWGGRSDAKACPWCNNPSEHKVHAVLCPMFNGKGEIR